MEKAREPGPGKRRARAYWGLYATIISALAAFITAVVAVISAFFDDDQIIATVPTQQQTSAPGFATPTPTAATPTAPSVPPSTPGPPPETGRTVGPTVPVPAPGTPIPPNMSGGVTACVARSAGGCEHAGYGTWFSIGDKMYVCDSRADGWSVVVRAYIGGEGPKLKWHTAGAAARCTERSYGDLAEGTTVTFQTCLGGLSTNIIRSDTCGDWVVRVPA